MQKEMEQNNCAYGISKSVLPEGLIISTIMNNSQDTIYFKDVNSAFIFSSKAHAKLFGIENPEEILGKSDFDYFPITFASQAYADEQNIIATGKPMIGRTEKWVKPDGEVTWLSASKYPLYDNEGKIIGTWGTSRDITALKNAEQKSERLNARLIEANKQLEALSVRDSLSGLYNHRHFYEELKKTYDLYKRHIDKNGLAQDFSVVFLDVDYFKATNDTYGHLMGDFAIKHIASIMIENTRSTDSCFRYGGDEFAILLVDTDLDTAKSIADKIRCIVEQTPITENGHDIKLTVSMGVASASSATDMNELIDITDKRLYLSKFKGRNQVS